MRTARQPATVFFALFFPLFLLAVNSGGLQAATEIPGFPTDDYLTFALGVPCLQAGLFAIGGAGSDLAQDIRTGFLDRLSLTPMQGAALLLGHLAGIAVLATMQGTVFLLVGYIAGASFAAGFAGAAVIVLLTRAPPSASARWACSWRCARGRPRRCRASSRWSSCSSSCRARRWPRT